MLREEVIVGEDTIGLVRALGFAVVSVVAGLLTLADWGVELKVVGLVLIVWATELEDTADDRELAALSELIEESKLETSKGALNVLNTWELEEAAGELTTGLELITPVLAGTTELGTTVVTDGKLAELEGLIVVGDVSCSEVEEIKIEDADSDAKLELTKLEEALSMLEKNGVTDDDELPRVISVDSEGVLEITSVPDDAAPA